MKHQYMMRCSLGFVVSLIADRVVIHSCWYSTVLHSGARPLKPVWVPWLRVSTVMFIVEKGMEWQVGRVMGSRVVLFMHTHAHTSLSMSEDALEARWSAGAMVGMLGTTVPNSPLWVLGRRFFVLYDHRGCYGGCAC